MTRYVNSTCAQCPHSFEAINGCYCRPLARYVEHYKEPACRHTNNTNNN